MIKYGDRVKIREGFFGGLVGTVVGYTEFRVEYVEGNTIRHEARYEVEFDLSLVKDFYRKPGTKDFLAEELELI